MADGYLAFQKNYRPASGALLVTPLKGVTALVTVVGTSTIYVQRLHVHVSSAMAGVTWTIADSAGIAIAWPLSAAVVGPSPNGFDLDFGPVGIALTAGTSLVFTPSAGGATGVIAWDAYQR